MAKDQHVLGYLFNSLRKEVLGQVATLETASAAWLALERMYSARSIARVRNLFMQLTTLKKGSMTLSAYFNKMKTLGDDLATTGKVITDTEMISFILNGLDMDYNPVVSSVMGRVDPINLSDLYAQLVAYESRLEMLYEGNGNNGKFQSSANSASRGRGGYRGRWNPQGRGRGGHPSGCRGNNQGGPSRAQGPQESSSKPRCQICGKPNHEAA